MNDVRPYASLSSGLLARKGTAKPAMRPQGFTSFEDLGWNDMGSGPAPERPEPDFEHVPSSIAALTPAPRPLQAADEPEQPVEAPVQAQVEAVMPAPEVNADRPESVSEHSVVAQQRAIVERFEAEEEVASSPVSMLAKRAEVVKLPRRSATVPGKKAAFTLRLDTDRHMRLRLACAVLNRSAQQIVTAALDEALASIPEIEALAERLPAASKRN